MSKLLKSGKLAYFSRGFFSSKWKEGNFELYDDSSIVWYENEGKSKPEGSVRLIDVASFICVGKTKKMPPRPKLPDGADESLLICYPGDKKIKLKHICWLLCKDAEELKEWAGWFKTAIDLAKTNRKPTAVVANNAKVAQPYRITTDVHKPVHINRGRDNYAFGHHTIATTIGMNTNDHQHIPSNQHCNHHHHHHDNDDNCEHHHHNNGQNCNSHHHGHHHHNSGDDCNVFNHLEPDLVGPNGGGHCEPYHHGNNHNNGDDCNIFNHLEPDNNTSSNENTTQGSSNDYNFSSDPTPSDNTDFGNGSGWANYEISSSNYDSGTTSTYDSGTSSSTYDSGTTSSYDYGSSSSTYDSGSSSTYDSGSSSTYDSGSSSTYDSGSSGCSSSDY